MPSTGPHESPAPYYYQLLDQTPRGRGDEFRATRHDEYEDAAAGRPG